MKTFLIFSVCLYTAATTLPSDITKKWKDFKLSHKKYFSNLGEDIFRRNIFLKKVQEIEDHNERYRKGLETYKMGINRFSDYTEDELLPFTHGLQLPLDEPKPIFYISANSSIVARSTLPESFDWRSNGMVTAVKDQKNCGSCWAFSTTGALESHYKIYQGSTVSLSEQQLIDCVPKASGCSGGWMADAYTYIADNGGINHDSHYPYEAEDHTCRYKPSKPKIAVKGYAYLAEADEDKLKEMVVTYGPISVAIDAGGNFASYGSGVYYNPWCSTNTFTHAVVVVGYGTEKGQDYWLVKNSWGSDWGLEGYIKMVRNRNNHCGIASKASYPVF